MKNVIIIFLIFLFGSMHQNAYSDGLSSNLGQKVEDCVDDHLIAGLRSCAHIVWKECTANHSEIQCHYNVSFKAYDYYKNEKQKLPSSEKTLEDIQHLISDKCFNVADLEEDRRAVFHLGVCLDSTSHREDKLNWKS